MDFTFDITEKNRKIFYFYLENLTLEQLNAIPKGFKNNIFWNIAHVVATQQLLVYNLSGEKMLVSNEFIDLYRKGSAPQQQATQQDVDEVKKLLFSTLEQTKKDFENNLFKSYTEYTVTTKTTLTNAKDAMEFNNFHEGIHLGTVMALKKLV